jgi:uncharacterized protein (TIGR02646 family)
MLQLDSSFELSQEASDKLDQLQKEVDMVVSFQQKVEKAQTLWKSKERNNAGEKVFSEIREKLKDMCVSIGICNYCEQSEASDIEHIAPKSFFPEHTFKWDNYLLACKQCNTGYKLDQCFVISNSGEAIPVPRSIEPPFKEMAFINPKTEDPNRFMIINTQTFKFSIFDDLPKKDKNKADKTIEILKLNERDTLIAARKFSADYFYERIDRLSKILKATTIDEIECLLSPYEKYLDSNLSIDQLKVEIKKGFKKNILEYQHPSVWHAIKKVESKMTPKWKALFDEIPEALNW